MRHQIKKKILKRKRGPRRALLKSLAYNLILSEKIKTTESKAKALKPLMEKLVFLSKKKNLHSRRRLISLLGNKKAAKKLLEQIAPRYEGRVGGYVRIIKLKERKGDSAKTALIEFV